MNIKKGVYSLFLFNRYLYIKHFKMKKLYYLDDSEKNRILEMHNKATKNQYLLNEGSGTEQDPFTVEDVQDRVNYIINYIDYWMTEDNMKGCYDQLKYLSGKWYLDDTNEQDKKLVNAIKKAKELYYEDEGEVLLDELGGINKATWGATANDYHKKAINLLQQADTIQDKPFGQGGASNKCRGWDWTKVSKKYTCVTTGMFKSQDVLCGDYGDYMIALIKGKEYTFFVGDGHLFDGQKSLGYYACSAKDLLEKTTGPNMKDTTSDMKPMMESKKKEFVRMITEAGWGDVGGGGSEDSDNRNDRNDRNNSNNRNNSNTGGYLSTLQNKIAEIDSSYKPTGSMDQTTINKVMSLLTKGVKPPEPTPTQYQVNQSTTSAQSED